MINQLIYFTTAFFFFLFPLFYLPTTSESYEYNKMALLVFFTILLLLFYTIKIITIRRLTLFRSSYATFLFFLASIFVISTIFQSPNVVVALTTPMSTTTIVAGFLLYLLLIHSEAKPKELLMNILVIDAILLSLYVIFLYTGILPQSQFTPAGSLLATAVFLAIIAVYLLTKIITYFVTNSKNIARKLESVIFYSLSLLLVGTTAIFLTIHLLTDQKPLLLPIGIGWMILLETLKNWQTLLLGVGPSNFITAFTLGKPVLFNQSQFWNIVFTSSSSFFLNLATEAGAIAGILFLAIFFKTIKLLRSSGNTLDLEAGAAFPLLFALALQMILPVSMSSLILTVILLAFASKKEVIATIDLSPLKQTRLLLFLPGVFLAACVFYFGARAYLAEVTFKKSLDALVNNQATDTYNFQNQAIALNPYLDRYHLAFAQTNLALANAIAAKKDLTDADKQNIPRLVQQAIDQARTAVLLYRTNISNWDSLTRIYTSLINYAADSDKWAIASYQQRDLLDPLSPLGKLTFGGFYLSQGKYEDAENLFRQAVSLKPDFANARFNLAVALREQKKYKESYTQLQTALSLVAPDSSDSAKIEAELKLLPASAATESGSTVTSPATPQTLEPIESSPSSLKKLPDSKSPISLPAPPITP